MRVLHFSSHLFPFECGGTEVFIENLINEQKNMNEITSLLWAVHDNEKHNLINLKTNLEKDNKTIIKSLPPLSRIQAFSGMSPSTKSFKKLLEKFCPDVVHIHNFNGRCGINHARDVKKLNIKLIITIHTTPCSCMGNGFFYREPNLDGLFHDRTCTANRLKSKGLPIPLANIISLQNGFPLNVDSENIFTKLLTSRQLTFNLHKNYYEYLEIADQIHVCAKWVGDLMIKQGFSKNKVKYIRAGITKEKYRHTRNLMEDGVLKLIFIGRCNETKGVHLIIKAIKKVKSKIPISLDIYAPNWEDEYCRSIDKLIIEDHTFKVFINQEREKIFNKLNHYDLLVIPSLVLGRRRRS